MRRRRTAGGTFLDTGTVAITLCALAAIGAARGAATALALRERQRLALGPMAGASLIGLLAAGAAVPVATELGIALAAGLILDFVLVRLPLWAVMSGWIGSRPWRTGAGKETASAG